LHNKVLRRRKGDLHADIKAFFLSIRPVPHPVPRQLEPEG
jgi:hypothetical protein